MKQRQTDKIKFDRQTIPCRVPPDVLAGRREADRALLSGSYSLMLAEDVYLGIMPFSTSGKSKLRVTVEGKKPKKSEQLISSALCGAGARSIDDAICKWVRECAREVVQRGEQFFEVAFEVLKEDMTPVGFRILSLNEDIIIVRRHNRITQYVPKGSLLPSAGPGEQRKACPEGYYPLPAERILACTLPAELRDFKAESSVLRTVEQHAFPAFMMPHLDAPASTPMTFDYNRFRWTERCAVAEATRTSGWSGRGIFRDVQTSYHAVYRFLRFERFKVLLREQAIHTLNRAISVAGARLDFNGRVVIEGLPIVEDVADAERRLMAGSCKFEEILEEFNLQ